MSCDHRVTNVRYSSLMGRERRDAVRKRLMPVARIQLLLESGPRCAYCGRSTGVCSTDPDGDSWHIDHIVPISRGDAPDHDFSNLAVACARCNWLKGNRMPSELGDYLRGLRAHVDLMLDGSSDWPGLD
jgi:5-methylcytosine-specific restriction endonuclease McrA